MESEKDKTLSKKLAYILRHGAAKERIPMDSRGYVKVSDILAHSSFKHFTIDDIRRVVGNNEKQRFSFECDDLGLKIKANQGHTMEIPNLELEEVRDPSDLPACIHGTYFKLWPTIRKQGLCRMKRQHIHFAPGVPGEKDVISGARNNTDLYIYVDVKKAMEAGIKFFLSPNNVILSPGDNRGFIKPELFEKVIDAKTGNLVYQSE